VRGNETLETPLREGQSGRMRGDEAEEAPAKSVEGHRRLVPALTERVGWPHEAQKGLRRFQSRRARAWAKMAAACVSRRVRGRERGGACLRAH